ncbi:DUF4276 family protein [Chitinimonas sp. JJ19]|uniref:DUF4276 family protein n=1 Tax=Chitinimonas sp. JJ19 TaxID=3109352 RepID=UPI002FFDD1DA
MSKIIGIIAEDASDVDVISSILCKYVDRNSFSIKKFVGNGCGKLRNKCEIWVANLFQSGCHHVLVFHDLDKNDETDLRTMLESKVSQLKFPKSLIVIPVEEIEAWLLSDENAIKDVFSLKIKPKRINDCESIKSPKEHLENLVWSAEKKRYLNTTHNKKIAEKTSIDNFRRCHSFIAFDEYVKKSIFKLNTKK